MPFLKDALTSDPDEAHKLNLRAEQVCARGTADQVNADILCDKWCFLWQPVRSVLHTVTITQEVNGQHELYL